MKAMKILSCAMFVTMSIWLGCRGNDGATGPTGPAGKGGPKLTGSIVGYVYMLDSPGVIGSSSPFGVRVSLEGTPINALSDSSGRWELDNVTTGIYNVVLSKLGYGTMKIVSLQFVGGGIEYLDPAIFQTPVLTLLPSYFPEAIHAQVVDSTKIHLSGFLSSSGPTWRNVTIFLGLRSPLLTSPDAYSLVKSFFVLPDSLYFALDIQTSELTMARIFAAETVYVDAFGDNSAMVYPDPSTGKSWYPSLSTTGCFTSFIMP